MTVKMNSWLHRKIDEIRHDYVRWNKLNSGKCHMFYIWEL